ncbi:MAG: hypothetical protein LBB50_06280, partial [Oscillospiraceae bacterium]|nr:hypothetical protein [Oscillospiraceae bacterium]
MTWNKVLGVGIAVICVAVGFGFQRTRAPEVPTITATAPAEEVRVSAMQNRVAPVLWQPVERDPAQNAAVMDRMDADEAVALVKKGFKTIILPAAFTAYTAEEVADTVHVLETLEQEQVCRILTLQPAAAGALEDFMSVFAFLSENTSFDGLLLESDATLNAQTISGFITALQEVLAQAELTQLPIIFAVAPKTENDLAAVEALTQTLPGAELLVQYDNSSVALLQSLAAQLAQSCEKTPRLTALFDLKASIPNGTFSETLQFFETVQACDDFFVAVRSAGYVPADPQAADLLARFFAGQLDLFTLNQGFSLRRPITRPQKNQTIST